MSLPTEVELSGAEFDPDAFENEEEFLDYVSDFLSEEYGYCHDGFGLSEPFVQSKKNYMITVIDSATYIIRASSEEDAKDKAWEYFNEREPSFDIEITDEEAEIEI